MLENDIDYHKLLAGMNECCRRQLMTKRLLELSAEKNQREIAFIQEQLQSSSEALEYYKRHVTYEIALDHASK